MTSRIERHIMNSTKEKMTNQRVHRFLADDLSVRISAVDATEVVEHMRSIQNTLPLSTVAVGRAMVGALLMASHLKGEQEVALDFQVNGPLQRVYAQASVNGGVRGFVLEPNVNVEAGATILSIRNAMGIGLLTVSSHIPHQEMPHRGVVHLVSSEIGEDIAHYYQQSYQIPTLVSLGVHLDTYGRVNAAGGILVELLPDASLEVIDILEKNLSVAEGISQQILQGADVAELVRKLTVGLPIKELDHPYPIHYSCACSKDRVLRSLSLLGEEEIALAIETKETISTQCQMCGTWYHVNVADLEELLGKMQKSALH